MRLYFCLIFAACAEPEAQNIVGLWNAIEKDGMQFPIVYEGAVAQEELGDPNLQRVIQEMNIEVFEDETGILVSHFDMTNQDGSTYEFSFPMNMTVALDENPHLLVATDSESGEEISMNCTHTQAQLLSCSYESNTPENNVPESNNQENNNQDTGQGTLTFQRPQ